MRVNLGKITEIVSKIADLTSGDKTIPGVLLNITDGNMEICYTDGHKSFVENMSVESEDGDHVGKIVVGFEALDRAIKNCQPSGSIKVGDIEVTFKDTANILNIAVDQMYETSDAEGNVTQTHKMARKSMDLAWTEPGADMKSAILIRMKYDDIFEAENADEFDRKELIDALSRTSVEKGKQIYISSKTQTVFVANQAHATAVPISKAKTLSEAELNEIYATVEDMGIADETAKKDAIKKAVAEAENRIHFSVAMTQSIAKALAGILSKISSDKVYLHCKEKYCNIFVDDENEKIGVWFEMAQASKAHTGALDRYASMKYETYQVLFIKDFLDNNIKSALNATKSEKIALKFEKNEGGNMELVIVAGSSSASVADTYRILTRSIIDSNGDLESKIFNASLKVLSDMIAQLKTEHIAIDIDVTSDGGACLRLSEVNMSTYMANYMNARTETERLCKEQGVEFNKDTTPTPVPLQLRLRDNALITKQYTMLGK